MLSLKWLQTEDIYKDCKVHSAMLRTIQGRRQGAVFHFLVDCKVSSVECKV